MITLSAANRRRLESVVRKLPASQRDVQRARIVLAAGDGIDNVVIAEQVTADVNTVSKWRKRFFEEGVEGIVGLASFGSTRIARVEAQATARLRTTVAELLIATGWLNPCRVDRGRR